ncbi:hypothetical protein TBLA_0C01190 [Henningerozyma blattae CBS 6284]|uniref:MICOS complex subunit MIC19 n=1 Tax=Henningerozyma blattae (strain ATCC 34711 / CBS 6284 / DSM 70876 / NBRC 10599 / NRRL Y-10934 / UCD 77-7) TaxID=1071380 RepID=I2H0N2_HENB6|nr:hypothetical protein TBLA_0C01190 [Tetrapisispora blattae CBS 6284]CCH59934.1 hypothetical protein TBLA_0C01190 [Tetrapisispora blattae CBS 6284]
MGAQPSKQSSEPLTTSVKTFVPETQKQIDLTQALITELDGSDETNYVRKQQAELYIERRVQERLAQLESTALNYFDGTLEDSTLKDIKEEKADGSQTLSTTSLQNNINDLNSKLKLFLDRDLDKTKSNVNNENKSKLVQCLRDNKGKPLNCYHEFEEFRKTIT